VGAPGQAWTGLHGAAPLERYARLITHERLETLRRALSDDWAPVASLVSAPASLARLVAQDGALDPISTLQHIDINMYLPDDILAKVDRTSMAVSLETRVPLLDHRLMEFVATIPSSLKLRDGTGKYILKQAMATRLPAEILTRRKMGFGVPLGAWFRTELRDMTHDLLLAPRTRERGIFRSSWVEGLLRAHEAGRRDCSARLWALLCLELWMRRWADKSPGAETRAA